MMSGRSAAW